MYQTDEPPLLKREAAKRYKKVWSQLFKTFLKIFIYNSGDRNYKKLEKILKNKENLNEANIFGQNC